MTHDQTVLDDTPVEAEFERSPAPTDQGSTAVSLATREELPARPAGLLKDLRSGAMLISVEALAPALAEYKGRRMTFRDWIKSQLIEGVHYGYPPGTAPKLETRNGVDGFVAKVRGSFTWFPESQWTHRPSLYQAGADFIIDLMGLRPDFAAESINCPGGWVAYRCTLYSREAVDRNGDPEVVGTGVGASQVAGIRDFNGAMKMACKSARVMAVMTAYGLSDLFAQDVETPPPAPHIGPEQDPNAPQAPPRAERVTRAMLARLFNGWRKTHPQDTPADEINPGAFADWSTRFISLDPDKAIKAANWTLEMHDRVESELLEMGATLK